MTSARRRPVPATRLSACCYRLTASGRACVEVVETEAQTLGSLSRYLHDVLLMCGSGIWFDQLREFMPPRPLEESLRALLALGLVEIVAPPEAAPLQTARPAWHHRPLSAFGQMAYA